VHADYSRIPDLDTLAYRVVISTADPQEVQRRRGDWHRPESGSVGEPNNMDIYEVRYRGGLKAKLELWGSTARQRRIFNSVFRRAADACLATSTQTGGHR
jgi:hypothetical protein